MALKTKVLFLLKRREDFNSENHTSTGMTTGLYNSASFVNDLLVDNKIDSLMKVVIDYNDIDKNVSAYNPTHVIIEALWVTPTKFLELTRLHPSVTWIVRLHSEIPFIANEGMAMNWLGDYSQIKNIIIACNSRTALRDVRRYLQIKNEWDTSKTIEKIIYLPNYYPQDYSKNKNKRSKEFIDIGCFGAIRPMKNHLIQALAAVDFAENKNKKLRFHVNAGRIEQKGEPVVNNLRHVFMHLAERGHQLVTHDWAPREEFLKICAQMDVGLQVSFSETFNIVGADFISAGVPLVCSDEIPWAIREFCADAVDKNSITNKISLAYSLSKLNVFFHRHSLTVYTNKVKKVWIKKFK